MKPASLPQSAGLNKLPTKNHMFWKQKHPNKLANFAPSDATEIVSQVGGIYAKFCDQAQLIKPRSSLPCSWFTVRDCFMTAYEIEYHQLSEDLHNSYSHVYAELAFFVDDELCNQFNTSLNVAARCAAERLQKAGVQQNEASLRRFIASDTVKIKNRDAIWESLAQQETCPRDNLLVLAETLSYCGEMYRSISNEWSAFANLVEFRSKSQGRL